MNIVVNDLMAYYERLGSGPCVVIIPGWGDTVKSWRPFAKALSRKYDVICLDMPGFGGTQAPPGSWGLNQYAHFVGSFIKKLHLEPQVLIGHSNGGAIIIRGYARHELAAGQIVLLASAGIRNTYRGRTKVLRLITKAGKVLTLPLPRPLKRRIRRRVYSSIGSDMLVAEHMQETFKRVVTDDVQHDASALDLPVLLLYGENDTATPLDYGRAYHELMPQSQLQIIGGAGHFVHVDQPVAVMKAIRKFLK